MPCFEAETLLQQEFALDKCTDLHSGTAGTTQGVAVRGGIKKHHN